MLKAIFDVEKWPQDESEGECYCGTERRIGEELELHCAKCQKWFHVRCMRNENMRMMQGLPFMVCVCVDNKCEKVLCADLLPVPLPTVLDRR